jgi:nitrite reductase/ring-hydroxylating ferredoxin subunit
VGVDALTSPDVAPLDGLGGAFNDVMRVVEGWYWALPSRALRRGGVQAVNLAGRELALYRGRDGVARALDAHCAHMGAHLATGRVEGDTLRCFFHRWRYDGGGRCVEVPSLGGCQLPAARVRAWAVVECYGLVWVWVGDGPPGPVPVPLELAGVPIRARLGRPFTKRCHPHVVLVNAIDEQHFNSVHWLPVTLRMEPRALSPVCLEVCNAAPVRRDSRLGRVLGCLYAGPLTYALTYSYGSVGTVTAGPDRLHVYLMFALRPTADGHTEGQALALTRRRAGLAGAVIDRLLLAATAAFGRYFARGDTIVFDTIRFNLQMPIAADRAVMAFMRHLDGQPTVLWADSRRPCR